MTAQSKLKKHAALFDEMASHVGVDLVDAFENRGALTLDDIGEAVLRCTQCSDPGHCTGWVQLDSKSRAPSYCLNRDLLDRLQGVQQ
ncbi:MAG: DUF6455 family protein [Arenibacterium sp.]